MINYGKKQALWLFAATNAKESFLGFCLVIIIVFLVVYNLGRVYKKTQLIDLGNKEIMKRNKIKTFQQKIADIREMLVDLADNHNVDFTFNYIEKDENHNVLRYDMLYSNKITNSALEIMMGNQMRLQDRLDSINRLLHNGVMLGEDANCNKFIIEEIKYDKGKPKYKPYGSNIELDLLQMGILHSFSKN